MLAKVCVFSIAAIYSRDRGAMHALSGDGGAGVAVAIASHVRPLLLAGATAWDAH